MHTPRQSPLNGQRYAWIGYVLGIACMAAMFITGLVMAKPQLMVMAVTMTALLAVVWTSTSAAAKKAADDRPLRARS